MTDAEWICDLVAHGLVQPSFVPPAPIRRPRDLTRRRTILLSERTREKQRLEKILEDAGVKLSIVASDICGRSGRAMLEALIAGERDGQVLADLAVGGLRKKITALAEALVGRFGEHHGFLARMVLDHIDAIDAMVTRLDTRIDIEIEPYREQVELLDTIDGVNKRAAEVIIAEIGVDMKRFGTAAHLASWAGLCPGNNKTAGISKSEHTRPGNRWLRRILGTAAMGASRTKDSYCHSQFRRLAARRGSTRALVAVGHTLLVAVWHMLSKKIAYQDLGADYFNARTDPTNQRLRLTAQLERLGFHVTLEPVPATA
jgi:transposase